MVPEHTQGTALNSSDQGPSRRTVSELPQETLNFAAKVFDLARSGDEKMMHAYLNAGLPANLTNERGESRQI